MVSRNLFKNRKNVNLIVLILQIHMLAFAFIAVLWAIASLNKDTSSSFFSIFLGGSGKTKQERLVRPATVIAPNQNKSRSSQ